MRIEDDLVAYKIKGQENMKSKEEINELLRADT